MDEIAKFKRNPIKLAAIDLFALEPSITSKEVANKLQVSHHTINMWRKDPNFIEACYERYMTEFGSKIPSVLNAMIREAQAGNVQAGRLVLEHSGKLVKNINVTIDSPFEKFLKSDMEIESDSEVLEVMDIAEVDDSDLPPRAKENQIDRIKKENVNCKKAIKTEKEKEIYNKKQKEWYKWRKRAETAGISPRKSRRPTPAQRKESQDKVIQAEQTQSN